MQQFFNVEKLKERPGTIGNNLIITGVVAAFFEKVPILATVIILLMGIILLLISILEGGKS